MARYTIPPPDEAVAFEELAIIIAELHRFALVFAICASDSAADEHIGRYRTLHSDTRIAEVRLDWPDGRIYSRLRELYEAEKPDAIFVTGMAAWTELGEDAKGNEFTIGLNHGRDYMHEYSPCPVVFWCTPIVYNFIRRNAHDFYSIATSTLRLSHPDIGNTASELTNSLVAVEALSSSERHLRISELQLLLQEESANLVPVDRMRHLNELGMLLRTNGDYRGANDAWTQAYRIAQNNDINSPIYGGILNNLARTEYDLGSYASAKAKYEEALVISVNTLGSQNPSTAAVFYNLAKIEQDSGNISQAKQLYEQALSIQKQTLGSYHPHTSATVHGLAQIAYRSGDYVGAKALYERSLAISEAALGRHHPDIATTLYDLSLVECKLGNLSIAKALTEQALLIYESKLGSHHPATAAALGQLANLSFQTNNLPAAQALAEQALAILETSLGREHQDTRSVYHLLTAIYEKQGQIQKSATMRENASTP